MPEYDFRDLKTGSVVTLVMRMAQAVPIGQTIRHKGRRLMRLPSDHQLNTDPVSGRYPVVSSSLPRWLPGCEHIKTPGKHYGKPIIRNKSHDKAIQQLDSALELKPDYARARYWLGRAYL